MGWMETVALKRRAAKAWREVRADELARETWRVLQEAGAVLTAIIRCIAQAVFGAAVVET
jgi:hypothetical protein